MEFLCGTVVGAIIETVVQSLLSFSAEEIGVIWKDNHLQDLKQPLLMLRNFLEDAETRKVTSKPVQRWLMDVQDVAFDADHVFDRLNYYLLHNKTKSEVSLYFSRSIPVVFGREIASEIKEIVNRIESINQTAMGYGLHMRIASAHASGAALEYLETDSFSLDPVFIGREKEKVKIVEMVKSIPAEEVVSVFAIVGMGGVGKTTLTQKVYHDAQIISHFKQRIWVHVSPDDFDPLSVLKKIAGGNVVGSRQVVLQRLQRILGGRKYLLVLDNVWNEKNDKWEDLMRSLKRISSVNGNVIIVTTTSEMVASTVKPLHIHKIQLLSDHDSWLIIKDKAFEGKSIPSEFETIGTSTGKRGRGLPLDETIGGKIARRCGGLPLAAQVVGSLLSRKSKEEWDIEEKVLSSLGEDGNIVSNILKLSYDHLPSPSFKKCFALCSFFPKYWDCAQKDELINIWMAEGLLQTGQEANMEIVGNKVFNILLKSSLLEVRKRDWCGNVTHWGMHDLVRDLAISALNSSFPNGARQVRYIYESPVLQENAKCLRALCCNSELFHTIFSNMARLHVLILKDFNIKELPNEIGNLFSLRLLDISDTRIESLPNSIGDLSLLQTLRAIMEYNCLKKLPNTITSLIGLRHLYIPIIKLPPQIGKLTSLQTLPYFKVSNEQGCGISELGNLKNLKGEIGIYNLEEVCNKEEANKAQLFHKPNIVKLKLVWNRISEDPHSNDENVLEGLQPHWNLKSLGIVGFMGSNFPLWTSRMEVRKDVEDGWIRLDNLLEIQLWNCTECEEVPMMGHLPHLKLLRLNRLSNVKSFYGIKEDDVSMETVVVFPALEKLELINLENLSAWVEVESSSSYAIQPRQVSAFRSLEYLNISGCLKLKNAPSHFPCLKELEIVDMESGLPLASICGSKLNTLRKLKIYRVDEMVCLPDELFNNNRDLLELEITRCRNFERLSEDVHKLNALETLRICYCENLKSIAYPSGSQLKGLTSLRVMKFVSIGLCNFPLEMVKSCAPSLECLDLTQSKSLTNMGQVMSILQEMRRLRELKISGVPISSDEVLEIGCLGSIELLYAGDYVSFKGSVDRIFPAFQCLRELELYGEEEWDDLPDQFQHLTTLSKLDIYFYGIRVLPEWLERLSSLRTLRLLYCKKLRHVASKKAMQHLTTLYIWGCPLLEQNLKQSDRSDDSEWSKVSHIRNVDGSIIRISRLH